MYFRPSVRNVPLIVLLKLLKCLAREIRIWSELKHPNVMPLLGYMIEGAYPSFVSAWMDRGSLHMCMKNFDMIKSLSMVCIAIHQF